MCDNVLNRRYQLKRKRSVVAMPFVGWRSGFLLVLRLADMQIAALHG